MNQETTALAPVMPVKNVEDVIQLGKIFAKSGMFGCKNEEQGIVLCLTCVTEKISPHRYNQIYHNIDGVSSMRADAMLAKFVERGGKYKIIEKTTNKAAIQLMKDDNDYLSELTLEEAMKESFPWRFEKGTKKKLGLKDNWEKPRGQKCMLWARVVSDGVRTVDPGVNMGVYTPEEVQDFSDDAPTIKTVKAEVIDEPKKSKAAMAPGRGTLAQEEAKGNLDPKVKELTKATVEAEMEIEKAKQKLEFDFSVFPVGKLKGQKFDAQPDKTLELAISDQHKTKLELQQGHLDFIKTLLFDRAAAKDAAGSGNNEPFPEE